MLLNLYFWGMPTDCNVDIQKSNKKLKRFHPLGQTETSMAGVIRGSR